MQEGFSTGPGSALTGRVKIGVRLGIGFALVLVLAGVVGAVGLGSMATLSDLTTQLYRHPFAVANAALSANGHIIAMHRSMKDVALSQDEAGIAAAADAVNQSERLVYAEFDIMRERFLGNPQIVTEARQAVADWKPIREEVIALMRRGERAAAANITRTTGAQQVALINQRMAVLIEFSRNKAEQFIVESQAKRDEVTLQMQLLLGTIIVIGIAAALVITRGITRPVGALTGFMERLAAGDKSGDVPATDRGDEIGAMARTVQVFQRNALEVDRLHAEQEAVKARAEAERRTGMLRMADDFERSVKGVVDTVSIAAQDMQATAQAMSAIAEEANRQATAVAAASEQASTNVQTVASAADQLSSSIGEISRRVEEAARIARSGVTEANHTNSTMQDLNKAAEKIGEVVRLIETIASQVNLLALNATIEAARAGDAGRGFAVVANEVKNLANQTAAATQEITQQITGVQAETHKAVQAIDSITATIKRLDEISTAIASAVEEQGAATREISRNVQQASQGTAEVSRSIAGVTQAASEAGSASNEVLGAAGRLASQSDSLRQAFDSFMVKVRA